MKAYIGLGSNLGDRKSYINRAVEMLGSSVLRMSSLYETEPVGINDSISGAINLFGEGRFLNAVAEMETDIEPLALLERLEEIEKQLGRDPKDKGKNKSRTIDLDILLYGNYRIESERLTIPHPRLGERDFFLKPLFELWNQ